MNHTFVICAYKESPYLQECINSLQNQDLPSNILIATSTDNEYIQKIAAYNRIPVFISKRPSGIGRDWNFALSCASTRYCTIAHQDDIYLKSYAKQIVHTLDSQADSLIAFTDYFEYRNNIFLPINANLRIKNALAFVFRCVQGNRRLRHRILGFGDFVCCPSVTFCQENLAGFQFSETMRSDLDWEAWERIFYMKGHITFIPQKLMCHRIHSESETTQAIADKIRLNEDEEILKRFWPSYIAHWMNIFYAKGQKSNAE